MRRGLQGSQVSPIEPGAGTLERTQPYRNCSDCRAPDEHETASSRVAETFCKRFRRRWRKVRTDAKDSRGKNCATQSWRPQIGGRSTYRTPAAAVDVGPCSDGD